MSPEPSENVVNFLRRAKHGRHPRWQAAVDALDARVARIERRFSRLDRRYRRLTVVSRMRTAVVISVLVHTFVIFGLTFKMPDRSHFDDRSPPLDVVLVNAKSQSRPVMADALAQHNLDGGGNTDEQRRASSPLPVMPDQKTEAEVKLALRKVDKLEREARQLMTQKRAKTRVESAPIVPKTAPKADVEPTPTAGAAEIMRNSLEIARLEAKISRDWDSYQQRPRRKFVGARTQEFRFARYIEDWRQKVERIGELNYPQAARDQRIYGKLVATVAIKSDGTVERIDIDRSSGFKVLDDAARGIVKLAAPYAPFPPDIAKEIDVLHITRTWLFTRSDQFVSE